MTAREVKNNPMNIKPGSIDDLVNFKNNNKVEDDVNVGVNNNVNDATEIETNINSEGDKMALVKARMNAKKKKEANKQVTVYLTPENYKRFNRLKEKGAKSELINELLNAYFEE